MDTYNLSVSPEIRPDVGWAPKLDRRRLARVEGHLMGPESFAGPLSTPPEDVDDDHRQAG